MWGKFLAYLANTDPGHTVSYETDKLIFKLVQTSSTRAFRVDDIDVMYGLILSVSLKAFVAFADNGKGHLKWSATSANDKDCFVVERSNNGVVFMPLAKIAAKGFGDYSYDYVDGAITGRSYYRLKTVNPDGNFSFSKIVMISAFKENKIVKVLYPIPSKDILHLQINNPQKAEVTLLITDEKGRQRLSKTLVNNQGINSCELDIHTFEAGVYYLRATSLDKTQVEKILVTK